MLRHYERWMMRCMMSSRNVGPRFCACLSVRRILFDGFFFGLLALVSDFFLPSLFAFSFNLSLCILLCTIFGLFLYSSCNCMIRITQYTISHRLFSCVGVKSSDSSSIVFSDSPCGLRFVRPQGEKRLSSGPLETHRTARKIQQQIQYCEISLSLTEKFC